MLWLVRAAPLLFHDLESRPPKPFVGASHHAKLQVYWISAFICRECKNADMIGLDLGCASRDFEKIILAFAHSFKEL